MTSYNIQTRRMYNFEFDDITNKILAEKSKDGEVWKYVLFPGSEKFNL